MRKKISMTNEDIYMLSELAKSISGEVREIVIPAKIGLLIKRNLTKIFILAKGINDARINIGKSYGVYNGADDSFQIPDDKISEAQNELNSLMSMKQEFEIDTIPLDEFDGIRMTLSQIDAITFMIETE